MYTSLKEKPLTVTQRTAEASRQAAEVLGFDDLKRLGAALAEAAAEGVRKNPAFAAHVRALYEEMAPKRATPKPRTSRAKTVAPDVELIPVKSIPGYKLDPAAPPDPYFLYEFYGPAQFQLSLERYTATRLQEAVKKVKAHHPRTKPKGTAKAALIDYIVEYVAGSGN